MSFKYGSIDVSQALKFQMMTQEQLKATPEYGSIVSYLTSTTGLVPEEVTNVIGDFSSSYLDHQFVFTDSRGASMNGSVILGMLNPMSMVLMLQEGGLVPVAPIPVFRVAAPVVPITALGSVGDSFGDLIPGFDPPRRILLAPFQGHVAIGTHFTREDGTWTLTAVFMNPTGLWLLTAPASAASAATLG